jgi:SAM-dependent methyltransferase
MVVLMEIRIMAEASFGGSVPENYQDLLVPLIFEAYAEEIVPRVAPPLGGNVLEIACGTGVVTGKLRERLDEGVALIATDVNPEMQAIAIAALERFGGVSFEVQDGTALTYGDDSFDCVVCQFGVMFYPDKAAGYAEAARVLKPGGTFVFNVWDSLENNPLFALADRAVATMIPEDPPPFMKIPFGYYDIDEIRMALQGAGFGRVDISVLPETCRAESAGDLARTFATGTPLAPIFAERGVESSINELESSIAAVYGDGPIVAPMQAITFEATLPG